MVTQDGRHRGHHLGESNHELDLAAAATGDVTFGRMRRLSAESDTYLQLKDQPVLLPPPLVALTVELANRGIDQQPTGATAWLFPGGRLGSHLYTGRLSTRLNQMLGIFVRPSRGAALAGLAAELPASVLAQLLGLSITTAIRWAALAAGDNAADIAARMESSPAPNPMSR